MERVSESTRIWSSRSIGARSRAIRSIAADAASRDLSSDEGQVSRADFHALVLALCKGRSIFHRFESCVESLRLASRLVLPCRSGGYRQS